MFSIKDEITLDMTSGQYKNKSAVELSSHCFTSHKYEILKSAAIYGANASGKSNLIRAIIFCGKMVLESHNNNENTFFPFQPFKFEDYSSKPSSFYIHFIYNEVEYEYSFSFTPSSIVEESLFFYPNGKRAKIFSRDETKGPEKKNIYHFSSALKRPMDVATNTSSKTLFVSRASQMDRDIAKEVFNFFNTSLMFFVPRLTLNEVERRFNVYKTELLTALQIADSDIVNIKMKNKDVHPEEVAQAFITYHKKNPSVPFDMETEESDGTKYLFNSMLFILDAIKNGKTMLWDEIELSLHNKIVEYILALFHQSKGAQLIFTTHNTNLLNIHKLRKDQIYFMNKKMDGSSDLYSLFDYKDFRDRMNIEKAYLQGRFDAIPYIDENQIKAFVGNEE